MTQPELFTVENMVLSRPVPLPQNVIIDLSVCAMKKLAGEDGIKAGRVKVTLEAL